MRIGVIGARVDYVADTCLGTLVTTMSGLPTAVES